MGDAEVDCAGVCGGTAMYDAGARHHEDHGGGLMTHRVLQIALRPPSLHLAARRSRGHATEQSSP